jgi:lipopolysaccharide heptosyltransferase I
VRLGSLGDLVHTLPAVAALRRADPSAEIEWLVDAVHREFLDLVPVITRVVSLPGRRVADWWQTVRALRARRYDMAVDFQGLIKSAVLARASGAARVAGFDRAALREPAAAWWYGERHAMPGAGHVIQKNLALARALGAAVAAPEFPITVPPSRVADDVRGRHPGPLALINPGAAWPNKRWPVDRFGQLARHLAGRHGLTSLVLWGPGERDRAEAVCRAAGTAAVVAPATALGDLVALSHGARLFVSGDTGPLHIAAALNVPTVSIFGPTDPGRNGPWTAADCALSEFARCACRYRRRCRRREAGWCLGQVTLERVADAVDRRLSSAG